MSLADPGAASPGICRSARSLQRGPWDHRHHLHHLAFQWERFCHRLQLCVSRTGLQRASFNKFMAQCFPRWITQSSRPRCQSLCKASCRWFSWLPSALLTGPDLPWTSLSLLLPTSWAAGSWGLIFQYFLSMFLSLVSLSLSLTTCLFQVNFLISSKSHTPFCPHFQCQSQICISQGCENTLFSLIRAVGKDQLIQARHPFP